MSVWRWVFFFAILLNSHSDVKSRWEHGFLSVKSTLSAAFLRKMHFCESLLVKNRIFEKVL